jgi:hypothetical protein
MALGLTQLVTDVSTGNLPSDIGQLVSKADNLTTICEVAFYVNAEGLTTHDAMALDGLLEAWLYFVAITLKYVKTSILHYSYWHQRGCFAAAVTDDNDYGFTLNSDTRQKLTY